MRALLKDRSFLLLWMGQTLSAFGDYAIFLAAQCMILRACIILRDPKVLIPTAVLGLPSEVAES
mgnify:CR=1 FL=1